MSGGYSQGWKRIGADVLRVLRTLVSVEDAPAGAQRPRSTPIINPATGLRMLGGIAGVDTSGCTYGQSRTLSRTQKR
jgi:hypothetical protein